MELGSETYQFFLDDLPKVAKSIIEADAKNRVFLFEGSMGAGKTTLIKEICRLLGSNDSFGSPTFSIVNEYSSPQGSLFHFDLYRVNDMSELLDIGFEDYLNSGNYCFIEWPQIAEDFIGSGFIKIELDVKGNNRYIRVAKF